MEDTIRILHVIPLIGANAEYGGPAGGTMHLVDELSRQGHSAQIASLWRGSKPALQRASGARVKTWRALHIPLTHEFGGLFSFSALIWIVRHARRFDIVHLHAGREFWVILTMLLLRVLRVPYAVQTHGMLMPRASTAHRLYDFALTRPATQGAAAVFYLTPYERRALQSLGWMKHLQFLPNAAVDIVANPPLGGTGTTIKVVTASRLHPRKRIADLVRAASIVHGRGVDIEVVIYGPDAGALKSILSAIREVGASRYIRYGGSLAYDAVKPAIREHQVFVLASEAEPFPYSLLEAMSEGMACICTTACGLAPYIEANDAGIVVSPGARGIAQALMRLTQPDLRLTLGANALELCRESFALGTIAERASQLYTLAIDGGRSSSAREHH